MTHDPRAVNIIARQLAKDFGDADGFLRLTKRDGAAWAILDALQHNGFTVTAALDPAERPIEPTRHAPLTDEPCGHVPTPAGRAAVNAYRAHRTPQHPRTDLRGSEAP